MTLGESDLSEFEIIYMKGYEGSLFFMIEGIFLPTLIIPAMTFCSFFWWLYTVEFFYVGVGIIFYLFAATNLPDEDQDASDMSE